MLISILIFLVFVIGMCCGYFEFFPDWMAQPEWQSYALYSLLFFVGISIGSNRESWSVLKNHSYKLLLIPLTIAIGSLLGALPMAFLYSNISLRETLAIGGSFGYYSLSSIMMNQMCGEEIGTLSLVANLFRELFTLVFTPLLVYLFGPLSGIASGGVTTMDTTLPVITHYSGKEWSMIAVFSGVVLTLIVPFLISFLVG